MRSDATGSGGAGPLPQRRLPVRRTGALTAGGGRHRQRCALTAGAGEEAGRGGSRTLRRRRGLVLVAAVGVLGVISLMGLAFATVMRLEAHAARNFTNAVRAEFVARSGIEDAIARLRVMARMGAEQPYDEEGNAAAWYTWRGTKGEGGWKASFAAKKNSNFVDDDGDGEIDNKEEGEEELSYSDWVSGTYVDAGDNYTLKVQDAASKINVNAGDNLGHILDNLCRAIGPPLRAADQQALVPRWFALEMAAHDIPELRTAKYASKYIKLDTWMQQDLFYRMGDDGRPVCRDDQGDVGLGAALYGDGFAIAGYRARSRSGFTSLDEVRDALTYIERSSPPDGRPDLPEEQMELDAKFAAIRPYITTDSWADTDQCGYGKFEHYEFDRDPKGRQVLVDRDRTWNARRNYDPVQGEWMGELAGCYVATVKGIGQGQVKTITSNTIDTIFLDDRIYANSEMAVKPTEETSYIIIGKDFTDPEEQKLYVDRPLSFHRAPVNVNTAPDKVLVAVLMGLQTTWGPAGYPMYLDSGKVDKPALYLKAEGVMAGTMEFSVCPSAVSLGRDVTDNANLVFHYPCPNEDCKQGCFFCNYGRKPAGEPEALSEAHMVAWQILKEREQTKEEDGRQDEEDGYGPFRGWDDLYFRVFRKFEIGNPDHVRGKWTPMGKSLYSRLTAGSSGQKLSGKRGIARLGMANFNSNTDILKFQPNLEWINRWGPNFTDLYVPYPQLLDETLDDDLQQKRKHPVTGNPVGIGGDVKLRVRPGELLDKTDLNIGTTEFSFDSGGVYDVESVGRVYEEAGIAAERRFSALIKVYDVWRESTQREFVRGAIMKAEGQPGITPPKTATPFNVRHDIRRAGQVAVDRYEVRYDPSGNPYEVTGPPERKALCTYPEPITPVGYVTARKGGSGGRPAALNIGLGKVPPAGYDGQILLATNNMWQSDKRTWNETEVRFYDSFTGDLAADIAFGDPEPKPYSCALNTSMDTPKTRARGFGAPFYQPLDYFVDGNKSGKVDFHEGKRERGVGLLGVIDSPKDVYDIQNIEQPLPDGTVVREGEGATGDLRPDGVYLGVTGVLLLDGSFEFRGEEGGKQTNINDQHATLSLWLKPAWHHGTRMRSTLPLGYFRRDTLKKGGGMYGGDYGYNHCDRGCHVAMRKYCHSSGPGGQSWYRSKVGADGWDPVEVNQSLDEKPLSAYRHAPWPWPCKYQDYDPGDIRYEYKRGVLGYVRDRFEHEIFNAVYAGNWPGGAHDFRLFKAGDYLNSHHDADAGYGMDSLYEILDGNVYNNTYDKLRPLKGAPAFSALITNFEQHSDHHGGSWIPGWLYTNSKPFYHFVPFRWHFMGFTWNPNAPVDFQRVFLHNGGKPSIAYDRTMMRGASWLTNYQWKGHGFSGEEDQYKGNWNHGDMGQPLEQTIAYGFNYGEDYDEVTWTWGNNTEDNPGEPLLDGHWNEIPKENWELPRERLASPIVPDHLPDRTQEPHLSEVTERRAFIDTMRTWGASPHSPMKSQQGYGGERFPAAVFPPLPPGVKPDPDVYSEATGKAVGGTELRLRSWAYEQYSSAVERTQLACTKGGCPVSGVKTDVNNFGVNRGRMVGVAEMYQRLYSGTYATMDEFVIFDLCPDLQKPVEFDWLYDLRAAGRYYTWKGRPGEVKPWFVSENLFESERAQSFAFATEEEGTEELVELGTVRWTVFTPYYCVDIPSQRVGRERDLDRDYLDERVSEWEFDYHNYFADVSGEDSEQDLRRPGVTQMWRHRPVHWTSDDKRSRNSSQRGCRVQIVVGASDYGRGGEHYPDGNRYYDDPEGWEPILDERRGAAYAGRHLKAVPADIRYKVSFELSDAETQALSRYADACLTDSPVFDDITVTYMRRPRVLEWHE